MERVEKVCLSTVHRRPVLMDHYSILYLVLVALRSRSILHDLQYTPRTKGEWRG
jgi:hypothetical protein